MEIIRPCTNRAFKAALFDLDGTISLIRAGWRDVMTACFYSVLEKTPDREDDETLLNNTVRLIDETTGKQILLQCGFLADEVRKRGGVPEAPEVYKAAYLKELYAVIDRRKDEILHDNAASRYRIPGCIEFLEALKQKGIRCYLASGTDHNDVCEELKLLGAFDYFDGGVQGASEEMKRPAKEIVMEQITQTDGFDPEELMSFGDGFVETDMVSRCGGYAVGLATDEKEPGIINPDKRDWLIRGGASMILPDYREYKELTDYLTGGMN